MSSSSGTIIESMSSRKLLYLVSVLILTQIGCFFLGAVISPMPNSSLQVLGTKCIDKDAELKSEKWYYPRGEGKCNRIDHFDSDEAMKMNLQADNIVFAFQLPHPREKMTIDYSRWQQTLMGVLMLDIEYQQEEVHEPRVELMMKARLGYRNKGDPDGAWQPLYDAFVPRNLDCDIHDENKREGYYYNCSMLNLFDLGSLHHDYYLLNVRLPSVFDDGGTLIDIHTTLGKLVDVTLVAIHQNGGFTKVWVSLKTVFFPLVLIETIWFWRRIRQLPRDSTLLEKMLLALACALSFLNVPLEYLTLFFDMPWLTLFNDMKQGIFYATLMTFWLVFTGEHCINETGETGEKHGLKAYWKKLSVVFFGCICLFIFDLCERGMQLKNPFYSIWATDLGTNMALAFIILAGISAGIFFLFLCYMIYKVSMALNQKQSAIAAMSSVRRLHYTGIIWRFRFLQLATLVTSALTCVGFIINRVAEGQYKWDESITLEYTSGFLTGVYGMWNIYIFGLVFLYAPSHKNWPTQRSADGDSGTNNGEEIEFSVHRGANAEASEMSSLTEFMRHQATD